MFLLKKLIAALVLPPTGPLLLALAGLAVTRWWRRLGLTLTFFGTMSLLILSVPVVSALLTSAVCDAQAYLPGRGPTADAIVVLGGGIRPQALEYDGRDAPGYLTLERTRYAAYLAKKTSLPVAVVGGRVFEGEPEAEVMRRMLELEFHVPVTWVERESRNTHENAIFAAKILLPAGAQRILLVTHGVDTRRARREFKSAGFEVIPAPTGIPVLQVDSIRDFVPGMGALHGSYLAIYELLGNLVITFGSAR